MKTQKDYKGLGAPLIQGEAERIVIVQAGEESFQRDFISV